MIGRQGCIYLISSVYRPGAIYFAMALENQYFIPDTAANDEFNILQINYCGLTHYIIEIPNTYYDIAQTLATEYNLKLVSGKPEAIGHESFRFSCAADTCFTLETLDQSLLERDLRMILTREHSISPM